MKPMRALGGAFSFLADAGWLVAMIVMFLLLFIPQTYVQQMPYYGTSVGQFLLDFAVPAALTLGMLQLLSGRWGPASWHRTNVRVSLVALLYFGLLCFVVFVVGYGRAGMSTMLINMLVGLTILAVVDYFVAKGEDFRATSLRADNAALQEEVERLRGALAGRAPAMPPTYAPQRNAPATYAEPADEEGATVPERLRLPLQAVHYK